MSIKSYLLAALFSGSALSATPVFAQTSSPSPQPQPAQGAAELEAIVVTAQKVHQDLQEVPIAVTTLDAKKIADAGVINALQLPSVTPGLTVSFVAGYFKPRIRGVGTQSDGPGVENPVALYVDGVYYASQLFGPGSLANAEQVAVLKGPQGTLFGRNTTGGVIQQTTRSPSRTFGGELETGLDNYETWRSNLYVTGPVSDTVRSNLFVEFATQGKGWGKNLATGNDIHKTDHDVSLRTKTIWEPTDRTSVLLNADYMDRKDSNILNVTPVDGTTPLLSGFVRTSNRWDVDNARDGRQAIKGGGASVTVDQELGFARLTSISAARAYNSHVRFAPPASPTFGLAIHNHSQGQQYTQEFQLISQKNEKVQWTAGLFGFHSDEKVRPFEIQLGGPLAPTPTSASKVDIKTRAKSTSGAAYGEATTLILPKTHLITGLRYTYERRTFAGSQEVTLANGFFVGAVPLPPIDPSTTSGKLSWRVGLDHQLTDDVMLYVSANRGTKSGGYNGLDPTNPPYAPEVVDAYSVGMKSEWFDRRLRLNAELFNYDYTNIQVTRYTTTAVIYNGGAADLYGADIDLDAQLGALRLSAGVEVMHSEFTRFPDAQFSRPLPGGGNQLLTGDAKGNRLPLTPDFTATLSGTYKIPLKAGDLDLTVTEYHNGGYRFEADNRLKQKAFDYLGASATFTLADKGIAFRVYGNNLLNEAASSWTVTQDIGYIQDFSAPPRVYGVEFKKVF